MTRQEYTSPPSPTLLRQAHDYRSSRCRVVADFVDRTGEVAGHDFDSHFHEGIDIVLHRECGFAGVAFLDGAGDGADVDDGVFDELAAGVAVDGANVVAGPELGGLTGLRHEVHEI